MTTILGTPMGEPLAGTDDKDLIYGYGGNDTIASSSGGDTIYGGAGDDVVTVADTVHRGGNRVYGGNGNDLLYSGSDRDRLFGGAGDDHLFLGFGRYFLENVLMDGGDGNDRFWVGEYSSGTLHGGAGDDEMVVNRREGGAVNIRESGGDWTITQAPDNWFVFDERVVTVTGVERLAFNGGLHGDDVYSGAGDDVLHMGEGANRALAGAGNDLVSYAATDANTLRGGAGEDSLAVGLRSAPYFVVGQDGTADDGMNSVLSGFEHYSVGGSGQGDFISLGTGNDRADGAWGNDTILGGEGNDTLIGGRGNDSLSGGAGNDVLRAGSGFDLLEGGDGDDKLFLNNSASLAYGGDGNDRIELGSGESTLYGGAGRDRFVVGHKLDQASLVMDFLTGEDRIQIRSDVLSDYAGATGRLAAGMLVFGAADIAGGQFVLTYDDGTDRTHLWWDRDGNTGNLPLQHLLQFDTGAVSIAHSDIIIL